MKLVIFDCDGTLVDSQRGIVLSMEHAFERLGLVPPSRAETLSIVGLSLPEAFVALAPEADAATRYALAEHYKNAFTELKRDPAEAEKLYPDCKAVISQLAGRSDLILGIATGKARRGVDRLLSNEDWHDVFATIQTADGHPSKPHPSMVVEAMRETDIGPEDTIMVGDTTFDILMARSANVGAMGVTWGYHKAEELRDAGAHVLVEDYPALPAALDDLFGKTDGRV